jgi:hypothetical protein
MRAQAMARKSCPIRGCETAISWREHLCNVHWMQVPQELRVELGAAYESMVNGKGGSYTAWAELYKAARRAVEALLAEESK